MPAGYSKETVTSIVKEYKSTDMTYKQLAEKYNVSEMSVHRYCKNSEKFALKKEIERIEEKINEKALKEALKAEGIDSIFVAKELKKLFNSDPKAAIQEYNKITGSYSLEKSQIEANTAMVDKYKIKLPKNERDV